MELLFKGKTSVAEYDEGKKCMSFTFDGYANVEEHKSMYVKAFEYMKTHTTEAFIMDFRNMKGTFTMLNDWVIETFRPAVAMGLKKTAMILNEDIFTQFAANDALKKVTLIKIQVFKDLEDADKWLAES